MNKKISKVYVIYRKDGMRPFGLFFDPTVARQFIDNCMLNHDLTRVAERQISWRWAGESHKDKRTRRLIDRINAT